MVAAYRAEWTAFDQALSTADAADPGLAATMVDPQLQLIRRNLVGDKANGVVGHGGAQVHPTVTSIVGNTATVSDCLYSTSILVYAATGQPVPPITQPEYDGVKATLVQVAPGLWKVQQQTVTDGKCQ